MRRLTALAAAVTILVAGGCSSNPGGFHAQTRHTAAIPGTLRYADEEEITSLNPLLRAQAAGTDFDMLVYGFFFNLDDKMRSVPELATEVPTYANGGISKDGLTLTYHLRRGVKWQDGAPFTARDVVFTVHAVLNPKNDVVSRSGWDDISSVDAVGDHEVRIHLKKIYAPAVATFFCQAGLYPVLPAHALERYPDINRVPFNDHPVGTGPFRFVEWVHGDHIALAANASYWRGKPKLDGIVYEIVPEPTAIVAQLQSHEIDAWFRAPSDEYAQLRQLTDYRIQTAPSLTYAHVDLNQKNPLFDDVRVRRAINYAIDKKSIVDDVVDGNGDLANSDVSPLSWAFDARVPAYGYNPGKSRDLLSQAGWKPGTDGIVRKGGERLTFAISAVEGAATAQAIEDHIQAQLRRVGIGVTIKNYPRSTFFASYRQGGILYRGNYDAALFSWVAGVDPDDSSEYMCDEIPPAGQNDLYWCDDVLGAAERGALSTYDQRVRRKYYAVTQARLASQSATIFLYFSRQIFVTSPALRGFVPAPALTSNWNTWEWSI